MEEIDADRESLPCDGPATWLPKLGRIIDDDDDEDQAPPSRPRRAGDEAELGATLAMRLAVIEGRWLSV